eukprot:TRINITY_DN293_c0_g2_i1.p1 TRINITY_DN293_c0_g2~~TRINITY_DN293_c0_g2_i1.p1  ORF type:complete len:740 (-),score=287.72 TRINITY_DN293_c0_g2_i1:1650-3869(-)
MSSYYQDFVRRRRGEDVGTLRKERTMPEITDEFLKKKERSEVATSGVVTRGDSQRLLTDRNAYITYLEVQLEKVTAANLTVQAYKERLDELQNVTTGVEEKMDGLVRIVRQSQTLVDDSAEETKNDIQKFRERLRTWEDRFQEQVQTLDAFSRRMKEMEEGKTEAFLGRLQMLETKMKQMLEKDKLETRGVQERMEEDVHRLAGDVEGLRTTQSELHSDITSTKVRWQTKMGEAEDGFRRSHDELTKALRDAVSEQKSFQDRVETFERGEDFKWRKNASDLDEIEKKIQAQSEEVKTSLERKEGEWKTKLADVEQRMKSQMEQLHRMISRETGDLVDERMHAAEVQRGELQQRMRKDMAAIVESASEEMKARKEMSIKIGEHSAQLEDVSRRVSETWETKWKEMQTIVGAIQDEFADFRLAQESKNDSFSRKVAELEAELAEAHEMRARLEQRIDMKQQEVDTLEDLIRREIHRGQGAAAEDGSHVVERSRLSQPMPPHSSLSHGRTYGASYRGDFSSVSAAPTAAAGGPEVGISSSIGRPPAIPSSIGSVPHNTLPPHSSHYDETHDRQSGITPMFSPSQMAPPLTPSHPSSTFLHSPAMKDPSISRRLVEEEEALRQLGEERSMMERSRLVEGERYSKVDRALMQDAVQRLGTVVESMERSPMRQSFTAFLRESHDEIEKEIHKLHESKEKRKKFVAQTRESQKERGEKLRKLYEEVASLELEKMRNKRKKKKKLHG